MSKFHHANLRKGNLAFFGKIIAGQSHEVTNVLNIINEVAGLQADIILSTGAENPIKLERLGALCEKMQLQVNRGERILRNINRFAHSVDIPISVFDIQEALTNILFLSRRWTNLRKVELSGQFPEQSVAVESSPFLFKQAAFLGIDLILETSESLRNIIVGYRTSARTVEITIEGDGKLSGDVETDSKAGSLKALMVELGGRLDIIRGGDSRESLELEIPLRHPADH